MIFAQKIYYNNKPLILTNDAQTYIDKHPMAEGYQLFLGAFTRNFRRSVEHLAKISSIGAIIEDISIDALKKELYELYEPIDAAGGVVMNEAGKVLMIFRRGKWDLPKGKRDDDEDIATCALREVSEETGLQQLSIGAKICDTYHVYEQKGEQLLKRTTWYKMEGNSKENLVPQLEENILEAKWIAEKELGPKVYKSYAAVREVLTQCGLKW